MKLIGESTYEVWQDGICVASVTSNNQDDAKREIMRYAIQYMQDGPIEVRGPDLRTVVNRIVGRS